MTTAYILPMYVAIYKKMMKLNLLYQYFSDIYICKISWLAPVALKTFFRTERETSLNVAVSEIPWFYYYHNIIYLILRHKKELLFHICF
jgi:hypothetical protein